ncbi:hypothetical protein KFE25_008808 [Diacronema lutheri]|uniref:Ankyrin repeat protein n=1 Tax=Diacronema lutheri TaxID=2081491 RepID=A0A8J5XXJ7_DIALT|nr:hypothetical protein KFE25_008808 [Diacronema lutheri]
MESGCIEHLVRWASLGSERHVRRILEHVDVDACDEHEGAYTALHAAAEGGHVHLVQELVRLGANPNCISSAGDTPLMHACCEGHAEVASCLIAARAAVDAQCALGETALMQAAARGHAHVVALLLRRGARHDSLTNRHSGVRACSALCFAIRRDSYACVRVLLDGRACAEAGCTASCWLPGRGSGASALLELLLLAAPSAHARVDLFAEACTRDLHAKPSPPRLALLWLAQSAELRPPHELRDGCSAACGLAVWEHRWTERTRKFFPPGLRCAVRACELLAARPDGGSGTNVLRQLPSGVFAMLVERIVRAWLSGVLEPYHKANATFAARAHGVAVHHSDGRAVSQASPNLQLGRPVQPAPPSACARAALAAHCPQPSRCPGAASRGVESAWNLFA